MMPQEYHAKQLTKMRELWDAGVYPALFQAVYYCASCEIALPEWASLAVLNMIQDRYHDGSVGGSDGAWGSAKGRLKMDYAHYLRWDALRWAMVFNFATELPTGRGRKAPGVVTKRELLAAAVKIMEGRKLARVGDGRQIEESYHLVEASRKAGEKRFAFDQLYFSLE